jgi:hypothetical protein
LDKVTDILSVDSICLQETDKTLKEVWSWTKKAFKSDLDTCLISLRSFSSFCGDFAKELKPVVMFPLDQIFKLKIINKRDL